MSLQDRVEVPELDEMRVARLERAVVAGAGALPDRPRGSSRRLIAAVGLAAVGLAAVGALLFLWLSSRGPADEQLDLRKERTRVVTGPGQQSELYLGDARVTLRENTDVAVERFASGRTLVELATGEVDCQVDPRPHRPPFQVHAGQVRVTVVGTAFQVRRSEEVRVEVDRGIVEVESAGESLRLGAGESWRGPPLAPPRVTSVSPGDGAAEEVHASAAGPEKPSDRAQKRGPSNPDAGSGSPSARTQKKQRHARVGKGAGQSPKPSQRTLPEMLRSANPLPPIYKQSYSRSLRSLGGKADSQPRQAASELQALAASTTGREASFALYARAHMLFFQLGEWAEVVTAAEQYQRRFPRGAEAEDMLWLRVRASCAAGDLRECRAAAHTYLRRYPDGVFQGLASRIVKHKN